MRALHSTMFSARAPNSGELAGLIVGASRGPADPWRPACGLVTVESVIVHGVHVQLGLASELDGSGYGWRLFHRVSAGNTLVVFVRNDLRVPCDLRAVLVLTARGERVGSHSTSHRRGGRARIP